MIINKWPAGISGRPLFCDVRLRDVINNRQYLLDGHYIKI